MLSPMTDLVLCIILEQVVCHLHLL